MKGWLSVTALIITACLAGMVAGEWVIGSIACRNAIGILFGRGHLLALAHGRGIYRVDLERYLAEKYEAAGESKDRNVETDDQGPLSWLISNTMARVLAENEKITPTEIDHECDLLQWQFRDEKEWKTALRRSGLGTRSLRRILADDLRAYQWIRHQIQPRIEATADECRIFYEAHRENFWQPERFRASHLFLAAPPQTSPEVVDEKRNAIEAFSQRLADGEDFFELVALGSEDEATKARGGDLGFFSESRMPPDFFAAVRKLQVGAGRPPVRTQLGFHIVQLTDSKPARQMGFDEAEPEIKLRIENEKRQTSVLNLAGELMHRAEFVRASR
jgi:parvulin-like peptidyl-prolyl isomerase